MSRTSSGVLLSGVLGCLLVLVACNPVSRPASSSSSSGASASATPAAASGTTEVPASGFRVIDGDTLELTSGGRVRLLGIDSCEMSTDEGPVAKSAAQTFLEGESITLTVEPGVDRDQYGRMLRYVSTPGGDMGEWMVTGPHTAVYGGRSDASADRLARLRAADSNGRTCDDPDPTTAPSSSPTYAPDNSDDHDHVYVPAPAPGRTHSGNSGHPCRPGERDGDNDGYCGEGR